VRTGRALLMNFHRQNIRAIDKIGRIQCLFVKCRFVIGGDGRAREVVHRPEWHVASKYLTTVQINNAAIIAKQRQRYGGQIEPVSHLKEMAEVGGNNAAGNAITAHYRRLGVISIAELSRPGVPDRVVEISPNPVCPLVGTVVEVLPFRALRYQNLSADASSGNSYEVDIAGAWTDVDRVPETDAAECPLVEARAHRVAAGRQADDIISAVAASVGHASA